MILGKDSYEAIVVGSGFGGAVAACRLAQAGVDVGVLERGRRFALGGFPRHTVRSDLLHWHHGGPYDIRPFNDVLMVQGAGYGGGSLIYANVQLSPPADVFAEGWPAGYSRASLDPYYDGSRTCSTSSRWPRFSPCRRAREAAQRAQALQRRAGGRRPLLLAASPS